MIVIKATDVVEMAKYK